MVNKGSDEPVVKISSPKTQIQFECSEELRTLIGDEIFIISTPVLRYNKYGWRNTRLLVLSQESLFLFKQRSKVKEMRLRTQYDEMLGLTISLHQDSDELVVHFTMQADLRLKCRSTRKTIVDTIKCFYATRTRSNLPIFGVR